MSRGNMTKREEIEATEALSKIEVALSGVALTVAAVTSVRAFRLKSEPREVEGGR